MIYTAALMHSTATAAAVIAVVVDDRSGSG